jgi:predicted acetyltransferase
MAAMAVGRRRPSPQNGASVRLVRPAAAHLSSYVEALERGWSPDNLRAAACGEQLAAIAADPVAFLASMEVRDPQGDTIELPDGSRAPKLPSFRRWMWDGAFCGSIGLRWQPGTSELPAHVLGHIGYAVVPWKRRQGHATEALRQLLEAAGGEGLAWVEITTDPDNVASQRVIEANGGALVETFARSAAYGGTPALRYRIVLQG